MEKDVDVGTRFGIVLRWESRTLLELADVFSDRGTGRIEFEDVAVVSWDI